MGWTRWSQKMLGLVSDDGHVMARAWQWLDLETACSGSAVWAETVAPLPRHRTIRLSGVDPIPIAIRLPQIVFSLSPQLLKDCKKTLCGWGRSLLQNKKQGTFFWGLPQITSVDARHSSNISVMQCSMLISTLQFYDLGILHRLCRKYRFDESQHEKVGFGFSHFGRWFKLCHQTIINAK